LWPASGLSITNDPKQFINSTTQPSSVMNLKITLPGGKKVTAHYKGFEIATDQPESQGGEGLAPSPFDLFLASIGTCAGIYIQSFCERRGIPYEGIEIIQSMDTDPNTRLPSRFNLEIILPKDFPAKYKDSVIQAAELCLVKKTIANSPDFKVVSTQKSSS
jgi:putative redox protein